MADEIEREREGEEEQVDGVGGDDEQSSETKGKKVNFSYHSVWVCSIPMVECV